jgi:hypothetical protein
VATFLVTICSLQEASKYASVGVDPSFKNRTSFYRLSAVAANSQLAVKGKQVLGFG